MIVRISIFSAEGTIYSYLSESDYFIGEVPASWNDGDEATPNVVVGVLETISQSDAAPPFLTTETVVKVTVEEEKPDSWASKQFAN